jgi:hypothetical protein
VSADVSYIKLGIGLGVWVSFELSSTLKIILEASLESELVFVHLGFFMCRIVGLISWKEE